MRLWPCSLLINAERVCSGRAHRSLFLFTHIKVTHLSLYLITVLELFKCKWVKTAGVQVCGVNENYCWITCVFANEVFFKKVPKLVLEASLDLKNKCHQVRFRRDLRTPGLTKLLARCPEAVMFSSLATKYEFTVPFELSKWEEEYSLF